MNAVGPGARILLVEDDANIRRFVRAALQDEGFEVFEAETCGRALIELRGLPSMIRSV